MRRWVSMVALIGLLWGCGGGPPQVAYTALTASAVGVKEVDKVFAPRFTEAGDRSLRLFETEAEVDAAMAEWYAGRDAIRAADSTLRTAQAALGAWDEEEQGKFWDIAPCLVEVLAHMLDTLQAVGLDPPPELRTAINLASQFWGQACDSEGSS